jgi:hypothetical protein
MASTTMASASERTIMRFDGKKTSWVAWEEKFLAKARPKGYKDILQGKTIIPQTNLSEEEESALTAEEKAVRGKNEDGYSDLINAMDTSTLLGKNAFNLVRGSKSPEFQDGNIRKAWERLTKRYSPKTSTELNRIESLFYDGHLNGGVEPDVFITYMEDL